MSPKRALPRLILASSSPRRRELLALLGHPFAVVSPGSSPGTAEVDETPQPGERPATLVQRLSQAKAGAVLANLDLLFSAPGSDWPPDRTQLGPGQKPATAGPDAPQTLVIAADTVVVLAGEILGKPNNAAEASQMLRRLRQQPHQVYTGLTVAPALHPAADNKARFITHLHQSQVWMRPYTEVEIEAYVASGAPLDKAGAYGIQDHSLAPVERLEGCFTSVMGLPLGELAVALEESGCSVPQISQICTQYTGRPCCQSLFKVELPGDGAEGSHSWPR